MYNKDYVDDDHDDDDYDGDDRCSMKRIQKQKTKWKVTVHVW